MGHGAWGMGNWELVIGHGRNPIRTRITFLSFFNSHCPLPITHYPLPITHCPLPIAQCPMPN
ncbi:MAG: hypothetical protein KME31_27725 [Tolypothrix carrinoi HA7290-LM1]|nr:hypothetical protein [Tolypothrix carrinoi HA7290-LM1]